MAKPRQELTPGGLADGIPNYDELHNLAPVYEETQELVKSFREADLLKQPIDDENLAKILKPIFDRFISDFSRIVQEHGGFDIELEPADDEEELEDKDHV